MRYADQVLRLEEVHPGRLSSFEHFLDLVTDLVHAGEVLILRNDARAYGAQTDYGLQSLLDTIGDCASIPMTALEMSHPSASVSLLLGGKEAIRYLCSFAPDGAIHSVSESIPLRLDYSDFAHLWLSNPDGEIVDRDKVWRQLDGFAIGESFGRLNQIPFMWMDAHRGQFQWGTVDGKRKIFTFDLEEHSWALYRKPTVAQCAMMMVPLLATIDTAEFEGLRAGYISERGAAGVAVFDFIIFGDRTGWKATFDQGDYKTAMQRASAQIDEDDEAGRDPPELVLSLLGVCASRLGHHDVARGACLRALASVASEDKATANLVFNLAQAHYRAGDIPAATELLKDVVKREEAQASMPGLLDAAVSLLAKCHARLEDD